MNGMIFDELVTNPDKVHQLTPQEAMTILPSVAGLYAMLQARASSNENMLVRRQQVVERDRLLTPQETAMRIGTDVRWVYRHAGKWPFTRRLSRKKLRFSEAGLNRWLETRRP